MGVENNMASSDGCVPGWAESKLRKWQALVGSASVGAKAGVTFENTSETEPLVCLRYFGPEVNPNAPAMGAYRKNAF